MYSFIHKRNLTSSNCSLNLTDASHWPWQGLARCLRTRHDTVGLHLQVQPTLASCERCTGLAATICRFWSFECSYHFIVDDIRYCTLVRISMIIGFWFDIINSIRSNDLIIMNPASPFVSVICQKKMSRMESRHATKMLIGNDFFRINILLTIHFPMGRQPTQVTYGWAIGEIKVFDDPNCQNPLTPISATGYETTWGLPGDVRSMNDCEVQSVYWSWLSFNYPRKSRIFHVNCRLASPNRTIDGHPYTEWRAPCHICEPKEARPGVCCSRRAMDEESPVIWLEKISYSHD